MSPFPTAKDLLCTYRFVSITACCKAEAHASAALIYDRVCALDGGFVLKTSTGTQLGAFAELKLACTRQVHAVQVMYNRRRSTLPRCLVHAINSTTPANHHRKETVQHCKAKQTGKHLKKAGGNAPLVRSPLCSNAFVICDLRCAHDRPEPAVFLSVW